MDSWKVRVIYSGVIRIFRKWMGVCFWKKKRERERVGKMKDSSVFSLEIWKDGMTGIDL